MTKKDLALIQGFIHTSVKEVVNGKIDKLSLEFNQYKADDEKWKREVSPAIQNMQSLSISSKFFLWLLVGVGGLSAFLANIGGIITAIRH